MRDGPVERDRRSDGQSLSGHLLRTPSFCGRTRSRVPAVSEGVTKVHKHSVGVGSLRKGNRGRDTPTFDVGLLNSLLPDGKTRQCY